MTDNTDCSRHRFTVKEFGEGTPYLAAEPYGPGLDGLAELVLAFHLPEGTDLTRAQEIAEQLNDVITAISCDRAGSDPATVSADGEPEVVA